MEIDITITWATIKWAGLPLFILSLLVLFFGSGPGAEGSSVADGLRWVVWPLFLLWFLVIFGAGIFS